MFFMAATLEKTAEEAEVIVVKPGEPLPDGFVRCTAIEAKPGEVLRYDPRQKLEHQSIIPEKLAHYSGITTYCPHCRWNFLQED